MFKRLFGKNASKFPEDPAVAPIEQILESRALPHGDFTRRGPRRQAVHALWICNCYAWDDAPTWLIYDEPDGTLRWGRVPLRTEASSVVDTQFLTGNHTDPELVLEWLQGKASAPWTDELDSEDTKVLSEIGSRLIAQK